jgi:hypothetical protein
MSRLWAVLNEREGLTLRGQLAVFLLAAVVLLLRAPGFFLHANFYAEDGTCWFAQAYNLGWFHSLLLPNVGYLSVAERIPAGPAMVVPLRWAPLVLVLWGALCQFAPVPLLLSRRLRRLGPLGFRAGLAVIYWFLPNSREVFLFDTNCMWHLAVAMLLLLVAEPPAGAGQTMADIALVVVTGLSGPFTIVLTPIALVAAVARRTRWAIVLAILTSATAAVQVCSLVLSPARLKGSLDATVPGFIRLFGGDLVLGATFGSRNWALHTPMILLTVAALGGAALYAVCFVEGSLEWRLIIAFGLIMLAVSLRAPLIKPSEKGWPILIALSQIQRYWYLPGLTLVWAGAWCSRSAHPWPLRWLGAAILIGLPVGMLRDLRVAPLPETGFARQARVFEAAPAGTTMQFVIPPNWTMELHKR